MDSLFAVFTEQTVRSCHCQKGVQCPDLNSEILVSEVPISVHLFLYCCILSAWPQIMAATCTIFSL
jgi:hypothetical protein